MACAGHRAKVAKKQSTNTQDLISFFFSLPPRKTLRSLPRHAPQRTDARVSLFAPAHCVSPFHRGIRPSVLFAACKARASCRTHDRRPAVVRPMANGCHGIAQASLPRRAYGAPTSFGLAM
ncbi:hypothetical protein TRVL_02564 [Trypanosoma vivax]|nr:hypothetical protein TRVL_02564 [Trypanosoma vivax]